LLLAKIFEGNAVIHTASESSWVEILQHWANEKLTAEDIKNNLLFETDNKGRNFFHCSAESNKLEILEEIWNWVNENLTA